MALSSIDIRRQEFAKSFVTFSGYKPNDIHDYLDSVAKEVDIYNEKLRSAYEQIQRLKNDLEHYQKVEEALQEALQTARENARKTQHNAEQKAALIMQDAESRSSRMIEEASVQAQKIVHESEVLKSQARLEVTRLQDKRDELTARLRAYLASEMELLGRIENQQMNVLATNNGMNNGMSSASNGRNEGMSLPPLSPEVAQVPFVEDLPPVVEAEQEVEHPQMNGANVQGSLPVDLHEEEDAGVPMSAEWTERASTADVSEEVSPEASSDSLTDEQLLAIVGDPVVMAMSNQDSNFGHTDTHREVTGDVAEMIPTGVSTTPLADKAPRAKEYKPTPMVGATLTEAERIQRILDELQ